MIVKLGQDRILDGSTRTEIIPWEPNRASSVVHGHLCVSYFPSNDNYAPFISQGDTEASCFSSRDCQHLLVDFAMPRDQDASVDSQSGALVPLRRSSVRHIS